MLIVAVRTGDTPRKTIRMAPIVRVGGIAVGIGALGTVIGGAVYLVSLVAGSLGTYDRARAAGRAS